MRGCSKASEDSGRHLIGAGVSWERTQTWAVLVSLIVVSCTGSATDTTVPAVASTVPPPTTTEPEATTTTTSVIFFPEDDERDAYFAFALSALSFTVFDRDEMGREPNAEMLVFGPRIACLVHSESGKLEEIIEASLSASPVAFIPPEDWTDDQSGAAVIAALAIIGVGMPLYCPTLPTIDVVSDAGKDEFIQTWKQYVGDG